MPDYVESENPKYCIQCFHYDPNDPIHAFGTCEILDEDFHATHICTCPPEEIQLVEALQRERDNKWKHDEQEMHRQHPHDVLV